MEQLVLDGRRVAKEIEADLRSRVSALAERSGHVPVLATILVGSNPSSVTYIRMKGNACKRVGVDSRKILLPEETTTDELINIIKELNTDSGVSGILLQHPVPGHIDEQKCFNAISTEKDVDGVSLLSFGAMAMRLPGLKSATPAAIMTVLNHYEIPISGKEAVVIGRSPILGKPVAMLLLNADATVTVCHSKTQNLPDVVRRADIVVAAVGKPNFVQADWIKPGAVLVDAGYNEGNIGDIDLETCISKSSAYTPVPGGVGPVTIMELIKQTVVSAEKTLCKFKVQ